jgi:GNAT superfamily N-acetyltransferase
MRRPYSLILRSKQSNGYDDAFMTACADELLVNADDLRHADYWIAETGTLSGYVRLNVCVDTGQIGAFFVNPDQKRQGIGRAL